MRRIAQRCRALAALAAGLGLGGGAWLSPALAHPHVWITTTLTPMFDSAGRFAAVRERWAFDYDYSAIVAKELDQNGDGQASTEELLTAFGADGFLSWIFAKDYFTRLTVAGREVPHGPPTAFTVGVVESKLVFDFTLPLAEPAAAAQGAGVDVWDPEFYYAIDFDKPDVDGAAAPPSCKVARREGDNLDPVAVMLIKRLGLSTDPSIINDPAAGQPVRVAISCS